MSPHLTQRGKWLFASGAVFVVVGAMANQALVVGFGMVAVALIVVAAWRVLMPIWLAEQRLLAGEFEGHGEGWSHRQMTLGERWRATWWITNRSHRAVRIRGLWVRSEGVLSTQGIDGPYEGLVVQGGQAKGLALEVVGEAVGWGSIQGVDVVMGDALGLVETRDYLGGIEVIACRPSAVESASLSSLHGGSRPLDREVKASRRGAEGMNFKELRDYQSGDSLRSIAWKATMRQQRLISRDFEIEEGRREALGLDISTSMKAGPMGSSKFDQALEVVYRLSQAWLAGGREVGLWSFDHDVFGGVACDLGRGQLRRIGRHLTQVRYPLDRERTALDDEEMMEATADYLRVQERLDFRRGGDEVDQGLLERWMHAVERRERGRLGDWELGTEPVGQATLSRVRQFWYYRGLAPAPPSELRAGTKEWGLAELIKASALDGRVGVDRLTIVSDLCGVRDIDPLRGPLRVAQRRGVEVRWVVPFTPKYRSPDAITGVRQGVMVDLFAGEEARERSQLARRLEALGTPVSWMEPASPWRDWL